MVVFCTRWALLYVIVQGHVFTQKFACMSNQQYASKLAKCCVNVMVSNFSCKRYDYSCLFLLSMADTSKNRSVTKYKKPKKIIEFGTEINNYYFRAGFS